MPQRILDVIVTSTARKTCIPTIKSFLDHFSYSGHYHFLVNIDNRNGTDLSEIEHYFSVLGQITAHTVDVHINNAPESHAFTAHSRAFQFLLNKVRTPLFFHLEDDWKFTETIDLDLWVRIFEANRGVHHIRLNREPIHDRAWQWFHDDPVTHQHFSKRHTMMYEKMPFTSSDMWSFTPNLSRAETVRAFPAAPATVDPERFLCQEYRTRYNGEGILEFGAIGDAPRAIHADLKQNYDAYLIWTVHNHCNFHCSYCRVPWYKRLLTRSHRTIKLNKLMQTLGKSDKRFHVSFTGGEPFLTTNILDVTRALTQEHYVSFTTNFVHPRVKDFLMETPPERIIFIIASFHPDELYSHSLMTRFIEHAHLAREKGINLSINMVAHPTKVRQAEEFRDILRTEGFTLSFDPFLGTYQGKHYPESYTEEEMRAFNIVSPRARALSQKGNLCNAGYNIGVVNPQGNITPCHQIPFESMGNIYSHITFNDSLRYCPHDVCECSIHTTYQVLFKKAVVETCGRTPKRHGATQHVFDSLKRNFFSLLQSQRTT